VSESVPAQYASLIRKLRPSTEKLELLGAGDINEVVLADGTEVFRFPKAASGRQMLAYEVEILRELAGKLTIQIPDAKQLAEDNSYAIFSYIPGKVLSIRDIINLSASQKRSLGQRLANLMLELNKILSVEHTKTLQTKYTPWLEDEDTYYRSKLQWGKETKYYQLYVAYYEAFLHRRSTIGVPQECVLHGDLHSGNLIFNELKELTGVIDFGDCGPGTIYNELRQLYRLGEDIAQIIIAEIHGAFGDIDLQLVRINAIMHEISILLRPESQPPHRNSRAKVARELLTMWLGPDWEDKLDK
jgi:aminoglycoside 2''-phosphotransferase